MRPVTDSHKVSRAKLAYIIDSTAAPVCIIAPISSWAAAVNSYAFGGIILVELHLTKIKAGVADVKDHRNCKDRIQVIRNCPQKQLESADSRIRRHIRVDGCRPA